MNVNNLFNGLQNQLAQFQNQLQVPAPLARGPQNNNNNAAPAGSSPATHALNVKKQLEEIENSINDVKKDGVESPEIQQKLAYLYRKKAVTLLRLETQDCWDKAISSLEEAVSCDQKCDKEQAKQAFSIMREYAKGLQQRDLRSDQLLEFSRRFLSGLPLLKKRQFDYQRGALLLIMRFANFCVDDSSLLSIIGNCLESYQMQLSKAFFESIKQTPSLKDEKLAINIFVDTISQIYEVRLSPLFFKQLKELIFSSSTEATPLISKMNFLIAASTHSETSVMDIKKLYQSIKENIFNKEDLFYRLHWVYVLATSPLTDDKTNQKLSNLCFTHQVKKITQNSHNQEDERTMQLSHFVQMHLDTHQKNMIAVLEEQKIDINKLNINWKIDRREAGVQAAFQGIQAQNQKEDQKAREYFSEACSYDGTNATYITLLLRSSHKCVENRKNEVIKKNENGENLDLNLLFSELVEEKNRLATTLMRFTLLPARHSDSSLVIEISNLKRSILSDLFFLSKIGLESALKNLNNKKAISNHISLYCALSRILLLTAVFDEKYDGKMEFTNSDIRNTVHSYDIHFAGFIDSILTENIDDEFISNSSVEDFIFSICRKKFYSNFVSDNQKTNLLKSKYFTLRAKKNFQKASSENTIDIQVLDKVIEDLKCAVVWTPYQKTESLELLAFAQEQRKKVESPIERLPKDLILNHICPHLTPYDLCSLSLLNKSFHVISNNNALWQHWVHRAFRLDPQENATQSFKQVFGREYKTYSNWIHGRWQEKKISTGHDTFDMLDLRNGKLAILTFPHQISIIDLDDKKNHFSLEVRLRKEFSEIPPNKRALHARFCGSNIVVGHWTDDTLKSSGSVYLSIFNKKGERLHQQEHLQIQTTAKSCDLAMIRTSDTLILVYFIQINSQTKQSFFSDLKIFSSSGVELDLPFAEDFFIEEQQLNLQYALYNSGIAIVREHLSKDKKESITEVYYRYDIQNQALVRVPENMWSQMPDLRNRLPNYPCFKATKIFPPKFNKEMKNFNISLENKGSTMLTTVDDKNKISMETQLMGTFFHKGIVNEEMLVLSRDKQKTITIFDFRPPEEQPQPTKRKSSSNPNAKKKNKNDSSGQTVYTVNQ